MPKPYLGGLDVCLRSPPGFEKGLTIRDDESLKFGQRAIDNIPQEGLEKGTEGKKESHLEP